MTSILGFVLTLSVLVLVHEWGHYRVARLCGVHVLAFSLGFGKVIWRRTDKRGCEWRLSAIPLGGYVRMLDSSEKESYEQDGLNFTPAQYASAFDRQSVYKRFAVVLAGPLMNLLLAVAIYAGVAMIGTYQPSAMLGRPVAMTQAETFGVQNGWRIDSIGGETVTTINDVRWELAERYGNERVPVTFYTSDSRLVTYEFNLTGVDPSREDLVRLLGFTPYVKNVVIANVLPDSPAMQAGLARGDAVLAVDGRTVETPVQVIDWVRASEGLPLTFSIKTSEGVEKSVTLSAREAVTEDGQRVYRVGASLGGVPDVVLVKEGLFEAIATGFVRVYDFVSMTLSAFAKMITGQTGTESLAGPLAIGDMAGNSLASGPIPFLLFLAMISVSLGAINLFPIPALDGGHLMFFMYEMVVGRPPSERVRIFMQKVGLFLIMGLMVLAVGNDFSRLFR